MVRGELVRKDGLGTSHRSRKFAALVSFLVVALVSGATATANGEGHVGGTVRPSSEQDALAVAVEQQTGLDRLAAEVKSTQNAAASVALSEMKDRGYNWLAGSWIDPDTLVQYVASTPGIPKSRVASELARFGFDGEFVHVEFENSLHALREVENLVRGAIVDTRSGEPLDHVAIARDESKNRINLYVGAQVEGASLNQLKSKVSGGDLPVKLVVDSSNSLGVKVNACAIPHCDRPLRGAVGMSKRYGSSTGNTGSVCSTGFFARSASNNKYMITAGHCFVGEFGSVVTGTAHAPSYTPYWKDIGRFIPTLSSFGDGDYAAVRIESNSFWQPTTAGGYYHDWGWNYITGNMFIYGPARTPQQGEQTCRYGFVTHYSCGTVIDTSFSTYVNGVWVADMFTTNACSRFGDSGGTTVNSSDHALLGTLTGGVSGYTDCPTVPGTINSPAHKTAYYKATSMLGRTGLTLIR